MDLYVAHPKGGSLFLQGADGSLFPATAGRVPPVPGRASQWRDVDGDGDADLLVYGADSGHLLRNDGGVLHDVTIGAGLRHTGGIVEELDWVDLDGDGREDLVLCAEDAAVFFRNLGAATFEPFGFESSAPASRGARRTPGRPSAPGLPPMTAGLSVLGVPGLPSGTVMLWDSPVAPVGFKLRGGSLDLLTTTPSWSVGPALPGSTAYSYGAVAGGKLVVMAGVTSTDTWSFDPVAGAWTTLAPAPNAVGKVATAAIGRFIYCAGGNNFSGPTDALSIYDTQLDTWTAGASLPLAITGAAACAIDGQVYVFGGHDLGSSGSQDAIYRYDPGTNSWSTLGAKLSFSRDLAACVAFDGKAFLFGGGFFSGSGDQVLEVYDPVADTLTSLGNSALPGSLTQGSAVVANSEIHVFGMSTAFGHDIYDPRRNSWRTGFPIPDPSGYGAAGFLVDRIGVTSLSGNSLSEFAPFDPPLYLIEKK